MYSFKEKMHHYNEIISEQHTDQDISLLKEKHPNCYVLKSSFLGRKLAEEVLYNLLDVASREEIIDNRRRQAKPSEEEKKAVARISEILKEMRLVGYTEAATLKTEAQELLVAFLPAEKAEKWAAALDKAMPELDEDTDDEGGADTDTGNTTNLDNANAAGPADNLSGEGNIPPVVGSEGNADPNANNDLKKKETQAPKNPKVKGKSAKTNTSKKRNIR